MKWLTGKDYKYLNILVFEDKIGRGNIWQTKVAGV